MADVRKCCKEKSDHATVRLEIAIGYAAMKEGELLDQMVKRADEMMYKDKQELKKNSNIPSR